MTMTEDPRRLRFDRLDRLSRQLDSIFRIPGTRFRVGYDAIASIVPVVGDLVTALPAAWIILESYRMGLPRHKLARQGINVALDAAVGSIPILGTIFDAGFRSNLRNVDILRAHLAEEERARDSRRTPVAGAASAEPGWAEAAPAVDGRGEGTAR